jgi:pimeloyl-ACP methyl ester carboxylesterase
MKRFTADDGEFDYLVAGAGRPSVILINGSGGPIEGWYKILPTLLEITTTFAYNRPGIGKSSKPSRAQTAGVMVDDLRQMLLALAVPRPWVLVGHSFGGLVANLFARRHPDDLAGVVMLEATAPDDVLRLKRHENAVQRGFAWMADRLMPLNPNHETLHAATSVAEIAGAPTFPSLPLTVITGTQQAMAWATSRALLALRAEHQRSLARLSPLGVHLKATRSGHFPQFTEPLLVTSAIRALVTRAQ